MKKNKLKLIFILILAAFLFSCSKEIKEQKPEETKVESSAKIEPKENEFLSKPEYNTHVKSPEQIKELEEKYKKSKTYEESLKQLRTELDKKESAIIAQIPIDATDADLEQKEARTWLYDHKKKVYNYTNFEEVIKEGDGYYCKQKIKSQNGGVLEYHVKFEKDRYTHKEDSYTVSAIELSSQIDIGQISEELIENQVHGSLYGMENDEKKDDMIKLFEEYENTQYPLYLEVVNTDWKTGVKTKKYKQYDMRILDYVKGNFTNSGYDEYFVMFYEDDPDPKIYDQFIERVRCFVVDEDKIIKDYYINVPSASFFPPHIERGGLFGLKNFGFEFSQGWVSDFNQNGKNEIYFVTHFSTGRNFLFIIEFNGEFFVTGYVSAEYGLDIESVDWNKKMIVLRKGGSFIRSEKFKGWEYWYDTVIWNEQLKEYILLKREYKYEKYEGAGDEEGFGPGVGA
ncbi:treponema denticola clustered lipoprotein [Treponema denticola OTK]|uniref:Treponema denticola clustered lipoprotein n=1 Tax=Treponema denticola OTK TaxID=999434 RepID=A0A0F6MNL0_TREDN|nr:clustered-type lipoprotein [Treponema denticola]EMB20946.1 treponema denticola clustered lipoprotein [Treponema denticola OTK]